MKKENIDNIKAIFDKCGNDARNFKLISENGFFGCAENDSTKTIFTDELVYFVRTSENTMRSTNIDGKNVNFPMSIMASEYDTFKEVSIEVTFDGLMIFLKELGLDTDSEWVEFVKKIRSLGFTEALGFNIKVDEDGKTHQLNLDNNSVSNDKMIPYLVPGLNTKVNGIKTDTDTEDTDTN